jgi:hypothetical protein
MSPLATSIYKHLVRRLRGGARSLSYAELARTVRTHHRSATLHAALGEVIAACRARHLPCLPAIVWRADRKMPGAAYFAHAHTRLRSADACREAWQAEYAAVLAHRTRYPEVPW